MIDLRAKPSPSLARDFAGSDGRGGGGATAATVVMHLPASALAPFACLEREPEDLPLSSCPACNGPISEASLCLPCALPALHKRRGHFVALYVGAGASFARAAAEGGGEEGPVVPTAKAERILTAALALWRAGFTRVCVLTPGMRATHECWA